MKSIINETNVENADVVILGVAYEKTASSHKGTKHGPTKIVECLNSQIEFFDRKFKVNPTDFIKTAYQDLGDLEILSPEDTMMKIKESSEKLLNDGKFIFLLGGEHAVSVGLLKALAGKYNPEEVTILSIDAHCDLRDDDSDYSENPTPLAHSAIMRRASEIGYNLVQAGIRTYCEEEYEYFSDPKNHVTVFEWNKSTASIEEILASIKTKYLYISIDVDGFDPSFMPGTGTPVSGGLSWYFGVDLIEQAIKKSELIGADIVEVSPMEDSVLTEYNAAQLCYTILAHKFQNKFK